MTELYPDEDEFLVSIPKAIHYTKDSKIIEANVFSNMDIDRQREAIAKMEDIPLENVMPVDEPNLNPKLERARRMSVAFSSSRWLSSWDPHADKGDPNLN